nr:RecName: Full=Putative heat shock protein 2 [Pseudotsuga menziesii]
ELLSEINR